MLKKISMYCLLIVMLVSFAACSTNESDENDSNNSNNSNNSNGINNSNNANDIVEDNYDSDIEDAIQLKYFYNCSKETLLNLGPMDFWQDYADIENYSSVESLFADLCAATKEQYERRKDKIEARNAVYTVTGEGKLSENELKKISESLQNRYNINGKITEGESIRLEVQVTENGDAVKNDTYDLTAIRYDGEWYLLEYVNTEEGFEMIFFVD